MPDTTKTKRGPGSVTRDQKWIVLTESTRKEGEGFIHQCGAELQGKTVAFTVRDGYFPLSGSGEVRTYSVPFCPTCEKEPSGHGDISSTGSLIIF